MDSNLVNDSDDSDEETLREMEHKEQQKNTNKKNVCRKYLIALCCVLVLLLILSLTANVYRPFQPTWKTVQTVVRLEGDVNRYYNACKKPCGRFAHRNDADTGRTGNDARQIRAVQR